MRRLHWLYAWVMGYFWLPCRACGRMFGGHEIGNVSFRQGGHDWALCNRHGATVYTGVVTSN